MVFLTHVIIKSPFQLHASQSFCYFKTLFPLILPNCLPCEILIWQTCCNSTCYDYFHVSAWLGHELQTPPLGTDLERSCVCVWGGFLAKQDCDTWPLGIPSLISALPNCGLDTFPESRSQDFGPLLETPCSLFPPDTPIFLQVLDLHALSLHAKLLKFSFPFIIIIKAF